MRNLLVGIAFLMFTNVAVAQGVAQDVDALESQVATLETQNAELLVILQELVALQRCHAIGGSAGRSFSENGTLGVDWRGCDKSGIELRGPSFTGGSEITGLLFNADLRGTDFTGAYLLGVAMNGSNLDGANFTNANLSGSNLTGANIVTYDQAQAYPDDNETIFDNTICPDGVNSDTVGGTCINNRTP